MTKINPTDYTTWILRDLEERWASVRDAVRRAASRIDLGGMRRNRHPVEYALLAEGGRLGPFGVKLVAPVAGKTKPRRRNDVVSPSRARCQAATDARNSNPRD